MANRDAPMGFTPVGMLDGGLIPVRRYPLLSSHIRVGVGDLVEIVNTGVVDGKDDPTSNPEEMLGSIVGIYDSTFNPIGSGNSTVGTKYIPASTGGYVDIALAVGNAVFQVQTSGTLAATDLFASADTDTVTSCDTTTGVSKMELAGVASTGAANWLIIDKVDNPSNAWGEFVELLVIPCESYFVGTTAQVRVGI